MLRLSEMSFYGAGQDIFFALRIGIKFVFVLQMDFYLCEEENNG